MKHKHKNLIIEKDEHGAVYYACKECDFMGMKFPLEDKVMALVEHI